MGLTEGQVIPLPNGGKRIVLLGGEERTPEGQADIDELMAGLRAKAQEDAPPSLWAAPVVVASPPAPAVATPAPPPGLFDPAAALTAPDELACRWHVMPNGSRVCVHAPTPADSETIGRAIVRDLERLGLYRLVDDEAAAEAQMRERALVSEHRLMVYLVLACCRQGEEEGAPPVFTEAQIEALRQRRRWGPVLDELAGIARALEAGQETQLGRLREWLTDFFGVAQSSLAMCSGKDAKIMREALTRAAAGVSAWRQHGQPWERLDLLAAAFEAGGE